MVISLGWLSPATSCGLPAAQATRAGSRCLLGLAPTGGCRATPVAGRAVGSYPTVSPLPLDKGRSVFCGPFRRLSAPRCYLAVCPVELGLSSIRPFSRRTATNAPHPLQAPKVPARAGLGQAGEWQSAPLLEQSADLAAAFRQYDYIVFTDNRPVHVPPNRCLGPLFEQATFQIFAVLRAPSCTSREG